VTSNSSTLYPLTYGQRALWLVYKLSPGNTAYNFVVAARVIGGVDFERLRNCFGALIARHASLRSNYTIAGGQPFQTIDPDARLDFELKAAGDLTHEQVMKQLADEAARPFNLERDRLLRVRLWERTAGEAYLLLVLHHSAIDFTSLLILLGELGELYGAGPEKAEQCLPPVSFQSTDFARWEGEMLAGPEGEAHWQYWRKLGHDLPLLDLPLDHPRPARQTFNGASEVLNIDAELTARLKQLAAASGVSLNDVLLAAFQVLLHHWSGQNRVLVGAPLACRTRPEFEKLVGFLANSVVLSADFTGGQRFREFLTQTSRNRLEAEAHQEYPFSLLVERLHPPRVPGRSPIFQALFAFYDAEGYPMLPLFFGRDGSTVRLGALHLESLVPEQRAAMVDLSVSMIESTGTISAHFQYNTGLFEARTIQWVLANYRRLLEQVAADPSRHIEQLLLASPASSVEVKEAAARPGLPPLPAKPERGLAFSLFYFASAGENNGRNKYHLLLEGARFADQAGLAAVWTPERHFHRFGGLYPNPAVTGAAIAALTKNVRIRAGSCVLPLHHPARVAEEWSVVDNLSNGRVELCVASGWNANDFVYQPRNYEGRKKNLSGQINTVRRLWRGETETFTGVDDRPTSISILPRPVQSDLPFWLSAFGSIETFRLAGSLGAGILTHLVGQSVEDLATKIAAYRAALREKGYGPKEGTVAVMLHTYLGRDAAQVSETVRMPFLDYLNSSMDLSRDMASTMGVSVQPGQITEAGINSLVGVAFDRYSRSRALFGTPESCRPLLDRLEAAGVDEIACLIDFGVKEDLVLDSLEHLKELQDQRQSRVSVETPVFAPGLKAHSHSIDEGLGRAAARRDILAQRGELMRTKSESVSKEGTES
jgi:natural product biosynthesis luciferase-like monooxygenase protein